MANNINTPYDDVGRTLATDAPRMLIPLINEAYGTNFTGEEPIELLQNENFFEDDEGDANKRVTDSFIKIIADGTVRYFHIEFQSNEDGSILIRIFEYGALIARRIGVQEGDTLTVTFPESALLALRSSAKTPDNMKIVIKVPGGGETSYTVPVIKVKNYTVDDIFNKNLYYLIPFHIFSFEGELQEADSDEQKLEALEEHYNDISERLEASCKAENISEYEKQQIRHMSMEVIKAIADKYANVQKGLGAVMGGKVLEYEAKTIYNKGKAEGQKEGRAEGKAEGKAEGLKYINTLKTQGKSSEEILDSLIKMFKMDNALVTPDSTSS